MGVSRGPSKSKCPPAAGPGAATVPAPALRCRGPACCIPLPAAAQTRSQHAHGQPTQWKRSREGQIHFIIETALSYKRVARCARPPSPGRSGQPWLLGPTAARGVRCWPAAARSGPGHGAGPAAVPLPGARRAPGRCAAPSAGSGEGQRAGRGRRAGEGSGAREEREGGGARCRRTHRAGRRRAPAALPACSEMSGRDPPPRRLKGTGRPPPTAPGAGPGPPRSPAGEAGPPPPHGSRAGPRDLPASALGRLRSALRSAPRFVSEGESREPVNAPSAAVLAAGPRSAAATPSAPGALREPPRLVRCPPGQ